MWNSSTKCLVNTLNQRLSNTVVSHAHSFAGVQIFESKSFTKELFTRLHSIVLSLMGALESGSHGTGYGMTITVLIGHDKAHYGSIISQ